MNKKGWIFLVFFSSAWMFIVGVLVGRGLVPTEFSAQKFGDMLGITDEKDQRLLSKKQGQLASETDLDFYDELKGKKHNRRNLNIPPKKAFKRNERSSYKNNSPYGERDSHASQSKHSPFSIKSKTIHKNKRKDLRGKKNTVDENEVTIRSSFTIQVASLRNRKSADQLVADLERKGFPAYRSKVDIDGKGVWNRVMVGYFKNSEDAGVMLSELKNIQFNGFIVRR